MARFRPFRGIGFSPDAIGDFNDVVAPPYDVIDAEKRDALAGASEFNSVHLILNREGHERAAALFDEWLTKEVLVRQERPCFYVYSQDFEADGSRRRTGLIGALHLEPFSSGVVRPHEQTFGHHMDDRLALTKQAKANLSPIFGLYSNPDFSVEPPGGWQTLPDIDVVFEGVRHRVWTIDDPAELERITAAVSGRTVYIADGHHRYSTALNYFAHANPGVALPADEDAPGDDEKPDAHVMAFLATFEDPGMLILPTHRELIASGGGDADAFRRELEGRFEVSTFPVSDDGRRDFIAALSDAGEDFAVVGIAYAGWNDYVLAKRKPADAESAVQRLSVSMLHDLVLGEALPAAGAGGIELAYTVDTDGVLGRVSSGECEGAFLLKPTRSDELSQVCEAGELMPQKSTYFYPKLLTGLVFHSL